MSSDRRRFLMVSASAAAVPSLAVAQLVLAQTKPPAKTDKNEPAEEGISAPEDLMREHGVLNRVLLIYEEGLRRLMAKTLFQNLS